METFAEEATEGHQWHPSFSRLHVLSSFACSSTRLSPVCTRDLQRTTISCHSCVSPSFLFLFLFLAHRPSTCVRIHCTPSSQSNHASSGSCITSSGSPTRRPPTIRPRTSDRCGCGCEMRRRVDPYTSAHRSPLHHPLARRTVTTAKTHHILPVLPYTIIYCPAAFVARPSYPV